MKRLVCSEVTLPARACGRISAGVAAVLAILTIGFARPAAGTTVFHPSALVSGPVEDSSCRQALARAVRGETTDIVPASCWHVGPITLGMTESAVEQHLGAPVQRRVNQRGIVALYVFPARSGPLVTKARARFRLALLRYVDGKLALIANDPPTSGGTVSARCAKDDPTRSITSDADTGPLLRFDGITVGDRVTRLARVFGNEAARNRSHDWYNYLPVPMSFDVNPNSARVIGFAIARDEKTLTTDWPSIEVQSTYNSTTCLLQTVKFDLSN